jgi:hypothetical protein
VVSIVTATTPPFEFLPAEASLIFEFTMVVLLHLLGTVVVYDRGGPRDSHSHTHAHTHTHTHTHTHICREMRRSCPSFSVRPAKVTMVVQKPSVSTADKTSKSKATPAAPVQGTSPLRSSQRATSQHGASSQGPPSSPVALSGQTYESQSIVSRDGIMGQGSLGPRGSLGPPRIL